MDFKLVLKRSTNKVLPNTRVENSLWPIEGLNYKETHHEWKRTLLEALLEL